VKTVHYTTDPKSLHKQTPNIQMKTAIELLRNEIADSLLFADDWRLGEHAKELISTNFQRNKSVAKYHFQQTSEP
jgi:hypothetical protein